MQPEADQFHNPLVIPGREQPITPGPDELRFDKEEVSA